MMTSTNSNKDEMMVYSQHSIEDLLEKLHQSEARNETLLIERHKKDALLAEKDAVIAEKDALLVEKRQQLT